MLKRKALLALSALTALAFLCGGAQAGWMPLTGDPVSLESLDGQCLIVEDKAFCQFDLFGIGDGGAIAPDPGSVFVQAGWDDVTGDYGLRFLLSWNAGANQTVNANLNFQVAILDDPVWEDWYIKDVSLVLANASATGTGLVSASETVWDGPIPTGDLLASLSASKQESDGGAELVDWVEFDPVKMIWVRKDISITGGTGANGSAHLSEMFQFFSQVPEPASVLVFIGTLGGLLARRRRRG